MALQRDPLHASCQSRAWQTSGEGWLSSAKCYLLETHFINLQEKEKSFIEMLQQEYYAVYDKIPEEYFKPDAKSGGRVPKADWEDIVFASRPSSGGAILKLSDVDATSVQ